MLFLLSAVGATEAVVACFAGFFQVLTALEVDFAGFAAKDGSMNPVMEASTA
jgi:hypothetical protein